MNRQHKGSRIIGTDSIQAKILHMMDDNKQLALRIDGALQAAGQEVTALRAELAATGRRLAELGSDPAMEHGPHSAQGEGNGGE